MMISQSLNSLINEAEDLYKITKPSLNFPNKKNVVDTHLFKNKLFEYKNSNQLQIELKDWQAKQYRKDIGLVFKATANYNFKNAIDEETNSYIKTRVRTELEWNILKMGYIYNRTKSKRLLNEIEILKTDSKKEEKELWRRQFKIDYNYVLNKEAIQLFGDFLGFENQYYDFLNKLYFQKLIKRENLLKVIHQIKVLESQILIIKKENSFLKDSVSVEYKNQNSLPLINIELDSFNLDSDQLNKINYKKKNIYLQHKSINDLNLSIYVNQNYTASSTIQKYFPSVGIRFRAPIRFNHRKKIIETKIKILEAENADKSLGKYNSVITYFKDYKEKLKDLQNQYKNWQIVTERIRILSVLKSELNNSETGFLLLGLIEEQFKILENVLALKRQLYKVLSHLYTLNNNNDLNLFFTSYKFNEPIIKVENLMCLTESTVFELEFQLKYLKAKNIKKVLVNLEDKEIQKELIKEGILFTTIKQRVVKTVAECIQNEIRRIKK